MHRPTKRYEGTYSLSNWLAGTLLFLSWIGCIVGFSGPLHIVRSAKGALNFYWDHVRLAGTIRPYETILPGNVQFQGESEVAEMCDSGGAGFLAMTVFAFICLSAALMLWLLRTINVKMRINREDSLKAEVALTAAAFLFMLIAVIIWGATCYSFANSRMNLTAVPRGWIYMIFTLFFMLGAIPLLVWMLRKTKQEPGLADMSSRPELAYPDWHGWEESWFRRDHPTGATGARGADTSTSTSRGGGRQIGTRADRDRGDTSAAAMTGLGLTASDRDRDRDRDMQMQQQRQQRDEWERDQGIPMSRQTEQEQRRDQPYMSALSHPGVSMSSMGPTDRDMTRDRDRGYFYEDRSRAPEKGLFGRDRQREREPEYSAATHAGYAPSRDRTGLRDYADTSASRFRDRDRDREQDMMQQQIPQQRQLERQLGMMEQQQQQQPQVESHTVPIQTPSTSAAGQQQGQQGMMMRDRDRDSQGISTGTSASTGASSNIPVSTTAGTGTGSTPSPATSTPGATGGIPIHQSPRQSRTMLQSQQSQSEPSVR